MTADHECKPVPVPGERGELACFICSKRFRIFLVPRDHSGVVLDIKGSRQITLDEVRGVVDDDPDP